MYPPTKMINTASARCIRFVHSLNHISLGHMRTVQTQTRRPCVCSGYPLFEIETSHNFGSNVYEHAFLRKLSCPIVSSPLTCMQGDPVGSRISTISVSERSNSGWNN